MLMPRKSKHRKQFRGRRAGYAKGQLESTFNLLTACADGIDEAQDRDVRCR